MIKSTSVIIAFVFFLVLISVQPGIGIGMDFRFLTEYQNIDKTNKAKIKKDSDSKNKVENKKLHLESNKSNERRDDSVLKPVNVGVELTRALFGRYLKKTE